MGDLLSIGARETCYGCGKRFLLARLSEWEGRLVCSSCYGFAEDALRTGEDALALALCLSSKLARLHVLRLLRHQFEDTEDQVTRGEI